MALDELSISKPPRRKSAAKSSASDERSPGLLEALSGGADKSPTHTFRLPGGKTMTLATDRVRARPAVGPQLSFLLGQNAIGLGLWGLFAPKGVNRFLGLQTSPQTTQILFGAREMATGMTVFTDPTKSSALWTRVACDVFDVAVLSSLTRRSNPKRGNARLALGVVMAVTPLDVLAAVRMTNVKRTCA
jgi:hypothetical protein